jgi:hypothetical protein
MQSTARSGHSQAAGLLSLELHPTFGMNRTIPSLSWNTRILVCTIPSGTESAILRSSNFKSGLSASMTFFTSSQCLLRSSGHKAFCAGLVGALIMPRWPKQNKHALREETVRTHEVVRRQHFAFYQPMPTHAADSCPSPDTITLHITPRPTERSAQPPEGALRSAGLLLLHADALPRLGPAPQDCRQQLHRCYATPSIPYQQLSRFPVSNNRPLPQLQLCRHAHCVTRMRPTAAAVPTVP